MNFSFFAILMGLLFWASPSHAQAGFTGSVGDGYASISLVVEALPTSPSLSVARWVENGEWIYEFRAEGVASALAWEAFDVEGRLLDKGEAAGTGSVHFRPDLSAWAAEVVVIRVDLGERDEVHKILNPYAGGAMKKLFLIGCGWLYSCLLWGQGVPMADTLSELGRGGAEIEPVLITDSPNLFRVPLSVAFDSGTVALFQLRSLGELLESRPEIFVKSYGPSASATPAFRGTGAGHTQVYWDGLALNSPSLGLSDLSLGNVGMFGRMGLSFGLRSLELGTGGLGGALVLHSPERHGRSRRLVVGQEAASFGNWRSQMEADWVGEKVFAFSRVQFAQGKNDFPFRNLGQVGFPLDTLRHSELRQFSWMQKVEVVSKWGTFSAAAWLSENDRNLPPTMLTHNETEEQHDAFQRFQLAFEREAAGKAVEIRIGHFREQLRYRNELAGILSNNSIVSWVGNLNFVQSARNSRNARNSQSARTARNSNFYKVGLQFKHDAVDSPGFPVAQYQLRLSGYALHQRRLSVRFPKWTNVLRLETVNASNLVPVGFSELTAQVWKTKVQAVARVGRNVHFPGMNDLYWAPGGNPDLLAEASWQASLLWKFHDLWTQSRLRVTGEVEFYGSQVSNWIQWLPGTGGYWEAHNVQRVGIQGLQASFEIQTRRQSFFQSFSAAYSLTQSRNLDEVGSGEVRGKQLIYTPVHAANFTVVGGWRRFRLRWDQVLVGERFTSRDNLESLPTYTLSNASLNFLWPRKWGLLELNAGLRNLWGAEYQTIQWRPMPGRNFLLGLRIIWEKQHSEGGATGS